MSFTSLHPTYFTQLCVEYVKELDICNDGSVLILMKCIENIVSDQLNPKKDENQDQDLDQNGRHVFVKTRFTSDNIESIWSEFFWNIFLFRLHQLQYLTTSVDGTCATVTLDHPVDFDVDLDFKDHVSHSPPLPTSNGFGKRKRETMLEMETSKKLRSSPTQSVEKGVVHHKEMPKEAAEQNDSSLQKAKPSSVLFLEALDLLEEEKKHSDSYMNFLKGDLIDPKCLEKSWEEHFPAYSIPDGYLTGVTLEEELLKIEAWDHHFL
eukprot:TRINITY_DN19594_c0_g1_i1.p1 TRINITY_DN19594_c0_g1~~TRINITY_DN19594_c0_g1_i1.p1  ORF type:complete len:275 (-),score=76.17 TRINITY_DN19594_c0_g1_i1:149-943(-)